MTLEDAYEGLLQYWRSRPDGGSRVELLQLAAQRGFAEPLLAVWLDLFLAGFVEMGWIDAPDYDRHLAPRVEAVGYDKATKAAAVVFNLLTTPGSSLYLIRLQTIRGEVAARIAQFDAELLLIDNGVALATAQLAAGPRRTALLAAAAVGRAQHHRQRDTGARTLAEIDAELAGG